MSDTALIIQSSKIFDLHIMSFSGTEEGYNGQHQHLIDKTNVNEARR